MTGSPHVFDVSEAEFATRVLDASQRVPVLVDFWAPWCGPCRIVMPVLARLAAEYGGRFLLAKVNTDQERGLASAYGIRSIPNVKVFRHGEMVDEMLGAQTESAIRTVIDRHVERESDRARAAADAALRAGDTEGAIALLRGAAARDPDNHRVHLDLAAILMRSGALEEAQGLLAALSREAREEPEAARLLGLLDFARAARGAPDTAALQARVAAEPADLEARYQLSARQVLAGEYEAALENLLAILQRNRQFRADAGRTGMLAVFRLLGDKDDLVNRYRSRMFNALH
jgi:putative thioredoxin